MTMYHYSNLKKLFFLKNKGPEMISVIDQKKTIAPHIKNTIIPSLNNGINYVKDEAINGLTNLTNDIIENKNIKESAKNRFDESVSNIARKIQTGSGKNKIKRLHPLSYSTNTTPHFDHRSKKKKESSNVLNESTLFFWFH